MINKKRFYDRLKFVFEKNFAWLGSNPSYAPESLMPVCKEIRDEERQPMTSQYGHGDLSLFFWW